MFAVNLIGKVNTSTSKRQKHSLILHCLWKSITLLGLKIMLLHSWLKQEEKGKKNLHLKFGRRKYNSSTISFSFSKESCLVSLPVSPIGFWCCAFTEGQYLEWNSLCWTIPSQCDGILLSLYSPYIFKQKLLHKKSRTQKQKIWLGSYGFAIKKGMKSWSTAQNCTSCAHTKTDTYLDWWSGEGLQILSVPGVTSHCSASVLWCTGLFFFLVRS